MDERRDLVDRTELRRRLVQEREANVEGSQWDYGWRACLAHVVAILNSLDAVECSRGWTRDEVLAELAKHPDNVCEYLSPNTGNWVEVDGTGGWVEGWKNPDVARPNVRVVRSTPDPEWVPLTKLVGRTIHGETEPVTSPPAWTAINGKAEWRWLSIPHGKWLPFPEGTLNLETGQVAVRPKAAT